MRPRSLKRLLIFFQSISALVALAVPQLVQAKTTWQATVGAESHNLGRQALAFLAQRTLGSR